MREYDATGTVQGEYKNLKPGLYESRGQKLYKLESHAEAVEEAADAFASASEKLCDAGK
jgi:hypothetical protein